MMNSNGHKKKHGALYNCIVSYTWLQSVKGKVSQANTVFGGLPVQHVASLSKLHPPHLQYIVIKYKGRMTHTFLQFQYII